MANTVAALQTLIDAIDTYITARLTGTAAVDSVTVGSHSFSKLSIAQLTDLRKMYVEQRDNLNADAGEYVDHQHQGIDKTGTDNTVYVGDDEE